MDDTKPWYLSQTIWASILQMAVGIAVGFGLIDAATGTQIQTNGPVEAINLIQMGLAIWAFYGRIVASKNLTTAPAAPAAPIATPPVTPVAQ